MLKRIPVSDLRVGMHLEELCGSWMDHPFWRSKFVLRDPDDIRRIHESGIREAWIDTTKGLDVTAANDDHARPAAVTREQADAEIDRALRRAVEAPVITERRSLAAEIDHAAKIVKSARPAVISMFHEARLGKAIDGESADRLVGEIIESVKRNPSAIISVARLKNADEYTFMHSVAVSGLMIALARQLGLDEDATHEAGLAGLLHDLGKAKVPNVILNKPGKLSDDEFMTMKRHPEIGHAILLDQRTASEAVLDVVLHHHERVDGTGYPHRLPGDKISLLAKMGAVCDVYDAVTSVRPYKPGWDPSIAVRKMAEWTKSHFDERVFQAFVKSVGIYPVGSLVRMESGRLAVVVDQTEASLTTPKVKVFYSTKSQTYIKPEVIDLSAAQCADRIACREDPENWNFRNLERLWQGEPA